MPAPLEGVNVVDLSRLAPGPYCSMLLGDLGADVLRIEEPGGGRAAQIRRQSGQASSQEEQERSIAFSAHGRNKRSLILNLKYERARKIFFQLAERADVILEGFRPGVVKRLGVDYETIRAINPRIVYCSLTGYGQDGPYQGLVGHDINYISMAGALGIIGSPGERPAIPSNLLADYAGGGMQAALAIVAALLARERTGQGQYIDVAMMDGVLSLLTAEAVSYFSRGTIPRRGETTLTGALPHYNVYETEDGKYLSIGSLEPYFYENLCRAIGRDDLIPDQNSEGERRREIFEVFKAIFLTKTRDEWFEILKQTDICVAPVYGLDEVFSDPQVIHRKMVVEIEHPKFGKITQVGIPFKFSDTPGEIRDLAALPGQHTDEVLKELEYSKEDIETLRKEEVVG